MDELRIEKLFDQLSNWGRWGTADQGGTVNLVGAEERLRGLATVQLGDVVSLSLPFDTQMSPENPRPVVHLMLNTAGEATSNSRDYFAFQAHGPGMTHIDALCHVHHDGAMYNGHSNRGITADGAEHCGVDVWKNGIVARGVLIDLPRGSGTEWLEPTAEASLLDLDRALSTSNVTLERGDIVFVRVGRHARFEAGFRDGHAIAGISPEWLPRLHESQVAVLACDGVSDQVPSAYTNPALPVHTVAMVAMGLPLIDNCYLERLSEVCASHKRWEFLVVIAPLYIPKGTGSPVNPIAIF